MEWELLIREMFRRHLGLVDLKAKLIDLAFKQGVKESYDVLGFNCLMDENIFLKLTMWT